MFDIFYTNKYDNRTALITNKSIYTFSDIKKQIARQIENLKNKKSNVVILSGDNYNFVINFFAALFSDKNIYLLTDKTRLNNLQIEYDILGEISGEIPSNYSFPEVDRDKPVITFFTSGSSYEPKSIKKTLNNLVLEAEIIEQVCGVTPDEYRVRSTTSMCHLFGLVFSLLFPLCNLYPVDIRDVLSPENLEDDKTILISTPTFLNSIQKYNIPFKVPPEYIFSAGSKLNEDIFRLLEKESCIIDIYGSTETGTVAFKTHYNTPFKIFGDVKVNIHDEYAEIISDYIYGGKTKINDKLELKDGFLTVKHRTDRLFKVYEKRISADELEKSLNTSPLIKDCYIMKYKEKLVCLCALSSEGQEYLLKQGVPSLCSNLKQYLRQFSEIVPQRWKFIDTIPMTKTGKIDKKLIEHIFNINLSFPVIMDRIIQENSIEYKIFFYKQCNFFKGHFPQFKLLAGVVQLYFAKELANIHFNLNIGAGQWKKIKFSNIIEPDKVVCLKLEKDKNSVSYKYYSDTKKYASGIFLCDNVFEELK